MSGRPEDYDSPNDQAAFDELQRVERLRAGILREFNVVLHTDYAYLRILEDLRELVLQRLRAEAFHGAPEARESGTSSADGALTTTGERE